MQPKPEIDIQNYICISNKGYSNLNLGETYSGFGSGAMPNVICIYPHGRGSIWVYADSKDFAKEPEDTENER